MSYLRINMQNFIKNLFGINKLEEAKAKANLEKLSAENEAALATAAAAKAKEAAEYAKLGPKEAATARKEAYIAVIDTKVNPENPRNGFFELDWNEYFIVQLKEAGYYGESDEEIADRWFQDLCRNIGAESGVDMDRRGAGYINVNSIGNGKSEIS
jgi:hypothetical protein